MRARTATLPVPPAGGRAPTEQLAAAQRLVRSARAHGRRLHSGDPGRRRGHPEEVVRGSLRRERVADIGSRIVGEGCRRARRIRRTRSPGSSGGRQDPHARFLRNGNVRPPVERLGHLVRVADAYEGEQQWTVGRHEQVDREYRSRVRSHSQTAARLGWTARCPRRPVGSLSQSGPWSRGSTSIPPANQALVSAKLANCRRRFVNSIPVGHQLAQRPETAPEARTT
jgi:hypothetical protein